MYRPFDLTGRSAVVTGGNGGIGYGMAKALVAAGARVAIWGSNPEKTAKAKSMLAADAGPVEAFVCDVADEAGDSAPRDVGWELAVAVEGRLVGASPAIWLC